jgi:hypothetical protein
MKRHPKRQKISKSVFSVIIWLSAVLVLLVVACHLCGGDEAARWRQKKETATWE